MRFKSRFKNLALFFAFIFLLSGCMSIYVPPMPTVEIKQNAKLGLLVNTSNTPTHSHVGTTIFNNYVNTYDHNWNMQSRIFELFKNNIEENTNYTVVDLSELTVEEQNKLNFVGVTNKQWTELEQNASLKQKLLEMNISSIITITEVPTTAMLNCSQFGCTNFYSQGQGMFSRSVFGMHTYMASASYSFEVELLDPAVDLMYFESLRELTRFDSLNFIVKDFPSPVDIKQMKEEEFLPIRDKIENHLETIAQTISKGLQSQLPEQSN